MSILLALDASSSACSVALWLDGQVYSDHVIAPREHTRRLMPMVDALLAEAGITPAHLDALAYGRGPGSFTGIRIAAGTVQGLAFGLDRPVIPVSTLETLAAGAVRIHGATQVIPAFDARMNEIYVAAYRVKQTGLPGLESCAGEQVIAPELLEPVAGFSSGWFAAGSGWGLKERMPEGCLVGLEGMDTTMEPDARDMACLAADAFAAGNMMAPHEAVPVYLRDQVTSRRQ
ncbi:tRNA (adenosine(37)-N6)-threonylcarbamoyltransferase complex dimerization subunit type 1 TsaB [Larsenimonas rhizosphaerae]|uniref:tRNA threonylcarbamoyladenosine biosynthesis protein TsaB n=1 Tax=Larsenimonas rhizosphaerae TaxID=2944682 RepID=A0AA41ZE54_9GAMM|nr:tRNA (adenosine(37)-N6)-threonylcarbamoyltransferase complex dimerization subunit type 1 TsaB [Larsenimonas rhizosphaerae]MCM2130133.1 tRNA (adenosine(37)-N6)-threonylcarbamoyltransferase complex dimerization subunit type 1 TsaB [Larsenimonas rhizosphaerae]MCX2522820.1 tRNA (adenosine(37)-N6)-threonylcarbamoyltransferase complex dimerization subunit type 1 TsaB [Larsenimonas rhizosphaerae]